MLADRWAAQTVLRRAWTRWRLDLSWRRKLALTAPFVKTCSNRFTLRLALHRWTVAVAHSKAQRALEAEAAQRRDANLLRDAFAAWRQELVDQLARKQAAAAAVRVHRQALARRAWRCMVRRWDASEEIKLLGPSKAARVQYRQTTLRKVLAAWCVCVCGGGHAWTSHAGGHRHRLLLPAALLNSCFEFLVALNKTAPQFHIAGFKEAFPSTAPRLFPLTTPRARFYPIEGARGVEDFLPCGT